MRRNIFQIVATLLLLTIMLQPVQASDKKSLEDRIKGWFKAVNEGNYISCLSYVAPGKFTGHRGLTKMMIGGGEELLLFSGEHLLPLSEYKIKKLMFSNSGYESKAIINAKIIYERKPLYIQNESVASEYGMLVYPAIITQRWVLLNDMWFIKSSIRLQYLGSQ